MDTEAVHGDRQRRFWTKFAFFGLLAPAERLFLVEHYLTHCRAHVFHLTRELAELEGPLADQGFKTATQRAWIVRTMRHSVARWHLEISEVEAWRRVHPDGGGTRRLAPSHRRRAHGAAVRTDGRRGTGGRRPAPPKPAFRPRAARYGR